MPTISTFHKTLRAKKWTGQDWCTAQVKLDGYRVTAYKLGSEIIMFGKDHRPHLEFVKRFPRLRKTLFYKRVLKMPDYTSVDAEIIVPGGTSSDVATALRDENKPMTIITFAIPCYRAVMQENKTLEWANKIADRYGLVFAEWFSCPDLRKELGFTLCDSDETLREILLDKAISLGYEGFVLKQTQYRGWFKIKETQTVDCIITGIIEGEGKYLGQIGALIVGLHKPKSGLAIIANVSGMTDAKRLELTHLWEKNKLFGKVVEVKYQEVGSKGRLRHPRYSRMRPDKPAKQCVYSQLADNC